LAENDVTEYVAYVSEQNLLDDINKDPVRHPQVDEMFSEFKNGSYQISEAKMH
jgi:heat shock protein HspQ